MAKKGFETFNKKVEKFIESIEEFDDEYLMTDGVSNEIREKLTFISDELTELSVLIQGAATVVIEEEEEEEEEYDDEDSEIF